MNPNNCTTLSAQAITWDIPTRATASTSTTVGTLSNGTSPGHMTIRHAEGLVDNVKVLDDSSTDSGVNATGFTVYGKQLIWYNGASYEALFWAVPQDNYWILAWNSDNVANETTTPVVIKTIPSSST